MRYELTDYEWTTIKPMLPNKPRGVRRVNDRRVLNGIFWVLRSGAPWRDFTPPVVQQDYTYLVPAGSSIKSAADADKPGVRIAVVRNHLSTLALSRRIEARRFSLRRGPRLYFRPATHWTCGRNGISPPNTSKLSTKVARLTRAGGPLRGEHPIDGGSKKPSWMARLFQRVP